MGKTHPTYTQEFKQQAVNVFETSGKSKARVARELGISHRSLGTWCAEFGKRGEEVFSDRELQKRVEEEMMALRHENAMLRQERDSIKNDARLRVASPVKFQFIHDHRHLFPLLRLCEALEVSEKGYSSWRKRGKSKTKQQDEFLAERIEDVYHQNGGRYGSPRIHAVLKAQGIHCGVKRVARLMREKHLNARGKK